eukprot:Amastigsp_a508995_18.p3 type:complete len:132 gc:universal Amastigsp_a508995_18:571-176(-)
MSASSAAVVRLATACRDGRRSVDALCVRIPRGSSGACISFAGGDVSSVISRAEESASSSLRMSSNCPSNRPKADSIDSMPRRRSIFSSLRLEISTAIADSLRTTAVRSSMASAWSSLTSASRLCTSSVFQK